MPIAIETFRFWFLIAVAVFVAGHIAWLLWPKRARNVVDYEEHCRKVAELAERSTQQRRAHLVVNKQLTDRAMLQSQKIRELRAQIAEMESGAGRLDNPPDWLIPQLDRLRAEVERLEREANP